ncbi:MAG: hypothetical protein GXY32_00260 [Ruminococcaceae bacterium]|nr:hypothetical protein [Oscillospiraceae bacterium]
MRKRNLIIAGVVIVALVVLIAVLAVMLINRVNGENKPEDSSAGQTTQVVSGVRLFILSPSQLQAGQSLDYAGMSLEYCEVLENMQDSQPVGTSEGPRQPLTMEMLAETPEMFALTPANGTPLEAGTLTITLQYTTDAGSFSGGATIEVVQPVDSSASDVSEPDSSASVSSEPEPQDPPEFSAAPAISVSGKTATITFKTDVDSTLNAIVSTSGEAIGTGAFYDYFRRDMALQGAVSKKQTYSVNSAGKSETYELPDLSKTYYLLVNAVENETDVWQPGVTVILLYSPSGQAPQLTQQPTSDSASSGSVAFTMQTGAPSNVYGLVTDSGAAAPTAKQVKDAGSGYTGTHYGQATAATNTDKEPYSARVTFATSGLAAGNYVMWVTAQSTQNADAPLSEPVQYAFTVAG